MQSTRVVARIALAVAIPLLSIPVAAQGVPQEGARVRVTSTTAPRSTGVLKSVTADSVVVLVEPSGARLGIARANLRKMEVSEGRSAGLGARKGALWGAAIGLAATAITLVTFGEDQLNEGAAPDEQLGTGEFVVASGVVGALWGAGIGAIIRAERWTQMAVAPTASARGIGMRVSFR